jgi:hypothetical protein
MMHTPLMTIPGHGGGPPPVVEVVVELVVVVLVLDVVVLVDDVVVEALVVVVGGAVVVVVDVVVVEDAVVEVAPVADVVVELEGGALPPNDDGTQRFRSGVNQRERFASRASKQTSTWPVLAVAAAVATPGAFVGVHSREGSSTRSSSRSPTFTGLSGANRTALREG